MQSLLLLVAVVKQVYPVSTAQVEEHPSPLTVLPSSQPKIPREIPSPQISVQVSGEVVVPPVHL
jgi:hypothetical protein